MGLRAPTKRDSKGQWVQGQTGRRPGGRLSERKEDKFYRHMVEIVTLEDWGKVVITALQQAIDGDWRARRWLSENLMGTPGQLHERLALEMKEVKITVEYPDGKTPEGKETETPRGYRLVQ